MAIKIRYHYKVYQGCDEATEKSRNWERAKSLGWSVWLCLGSSTLFGANAISQLVTNTFDAEMFWPMIILFAVFLFIAYSYVFRSKYVYPTCEELFLKSRKTEENREEIDIIISEISNKKWKDVKSSLLKFSAIYFAIFIALTILFCINN